MQKARKRKRIERDYAITQGTRGASDTDSDDELRPRGKGRHTKVEGNGLGWWSSFLHGIESHPNLPNILSYYAQLTLNFFLAGLAIYGLWSFWVTIQSDVNKASEDATSLVVAEMAKCAKDYVDNGCAKSTRPPALEAVCDNWEHCMNRDPNSVGRAKISAHTFAQIFNSFIEPISYKAMVNLLLPILIYIGGAYVYADICRPHRHSSHTSQQPRFRHVSQTHPPSSCPIILRSTSHIRPTLSVGTSTTNPST